MFGAWDLSYYAFLKLWLDWPAGLLTYDVLFLLPTVWVAPVLCPVLISLALVGLASACFWLDTRRTVIAPRAGYWLAGLVGGGLVLYAFMAEAGYYLAGGMPPRFPWPPFAVGFLLALLSGLHYLYRQSRRRGPTFR